MAIVFAEVLVIIAFSELTSDKVSSRMREEQNK